MSNAKTSSSNITLHTGRSLKLHGGVRGKIIKMPEKLALDRQFYDKTENRFDFKVITQIEL